MIEDIIGLSEKHIESILKDLYKNGYYFHNLEHTYDVYHRAKYLAQKEGISKSDTELLLIAALFHDTGFLYSYDDNEKIGAEIADKYLTLYNFVPDKIYIVKQIILATIPFRKPNNILEEIIKDSDLDNLGRDDCFERSECLRKELFLVKGKSFEDKDWIINLYNFIDKQNFFTKTQLQERLQRLDFNKKYLKSQLMEVL